MLGIGDKFPAYDLTGVVSNDPNKAFQQFKSSGQAGKWQVVFFWPKDFTFVCPTEIAAFGKLNKEFSDRGAQLFGVSIDSEFVHLAWRKRRAVPVQLAEGAGHPQGGLIWTLSNWMPFAIRSRTMPAT
jgi:alkyl hydroperoxide reductase subunit AhpC